MGTRVHVVAGDVSKVADLQRVFAGIDAGMPPLRGVIHAAGVLEDGALLRQSWEPFARVLAPKVDGSWLLHRATLHRRLDFFVLYSSIASILGSPGQGSHAAANAFLDALALHRRAHGLPALGIGWGIWSEVGSAAERGVGERLAAHGVGTIAPDGGLQVLEALLTGDAAYMAVQPVDWSRFLGALGATPSWLSDVAMQADSTRSAPAAVRSTGARPTAPEAGFIERLRATPADGQRDLLLAHLQQQIGRVVGLRADEEIDERQPLRDVGVDSLMAVELRNRLSVTLGNGRTLPATLVFDHPTIAALVHYLAGQVLALEWALPTATAAPSAPDLLHQIEDLTDEDVERLLAGAGDA
jgi:acyl carrier protein